jgi:cytochrome c oxidase subunit I
LLGGILFFFGGIGGITNASYNINLVIHNTSWVPGHFHLTVATGVTLTFMGISYWLIPYLTGRKLWKPKLALVQTWIWFIGMLIFSNATHVLGLLGAPRRTQLGMAPYVPPEWAGRLIQEGIGGSLLFIGAYMFVVIMAATALSKKKATADEQVEIPVAESIRDPQLTPGWLDRWAPWLIGAFVLVLIAYGPQLVSQISNISLTSPGFRVW